MTDRNLEQRKKDLVARRAKLSPTKQALLDRRRQGTEQNVSTSPKVTSSLVTIQTGDEDQLPLFLVHPGSGHVLCYSDLARHLGPARPCYALQARGLGDEQEPETQIETMAQHYVAELQTVQPHGPYLLGGWSLGGLVAFEMAQRLLAQGQEIALLILLDSYVSSGEAIPEDELTLLATFAQELGIIWRSVPFDLNYLKELNSDARLAYLLDRAQRAEVIPANVALAQIRQLFHVFQSNVKAFHRYLPQAYSGQIIFFKASEPLGGSPATPETDWNKLVLDGLDLRVVPGNHYTILREPNVGNLAEQLEPQLRLADEVLLRANAKLAG